MRGLCEAHHNAWRETSSHVRAGVQTVRARVGVGDTLLGEELGRIKAAPTALPWEVDGALVGHADGLRRRINRMLDSGRLLRG